MVAVQVCPCHTQPLLVIFSFHNGLAQGKVPVELNTVLLELVSSLLFSATHDHTPAVNVTALMCVIVSKFYASWCNLYKLF